MLKIYGRGRTRSIKCLWAAEEAGISYEYVSIDMSKGEHKSTEFNKLNPAQKVPVLVDGDFTLSESSAICTYIGSRSKHSSLVPPDLSPERALYDQWVSFVISELEQPLWLQAKHTFVLPESLRISNIREVATFEWNKVLKPLAKQLEDRQYILGDSFSIADVMIGYTLDWAKRAEFDINVGKMAEYHGRVMKRPAFLTALSKAGV